MARSSDAWQDPAQVHPSIKIMQGIKGLTLVTALSRTPGDIEVTYQSGRKSLQSPSACIHLVDGSDCYVGSGSKRRVRTIVYRAPAQRPISIQDSGFSTARYPLPCESTVHRVTKLAA